MRNETKDSEGQSVMGSGRKYPYSRIPESLHIKTKKTKPIIQYSQVGFTLIELIIVIFLITLILGMSSFFFANNLSSVRFNAAVRDMSATIRYARSLSQTNGEDQTVIMDLDTKKYGLEGRGEKKIPPDINIKILDPFSGEQYNKGEFPILFHATGGVEGGTIVLWNDKKTATIQMDPVVGTLVIK